jgi:hypothetical protein
MHLSSQRNLLLIGLDDKSHLEKLVFTSTEHLQRSSSSLVVIPPFLSVGGGDVIMLAPTTVGLRYITFYFISFVRANLVTETKFENHGLVIVQVSQNQAAVCQDPQNQIFVVKNGGFVALAVQGSYKVLDVVDQTHLGRAIIDKYTKTVLAVTQDVMMGKNFVAATLYVSFPLIEIARP